jgi:F420-non-reducing hydrogenase iron-sulfur subunit
VDEEVGNEKARVLVFSTENISDAGIDLAGSSHLHYSPSVFVIPVPCSSCIRPSWIVYALEVGFDGVLIAADGTDCTYVQDCTKRTAELTERAQVLLERAGYDPGRVKMTAICSVCAEAFVSHTVNFQKTLSDLGSTRKVASDET